MATQQIFEGSIRTELGRCGLRIYDTDTDGTTPDLWNGDILGGVELQFGDTGQSGEGLPIGAFGSFFDLDFVDNPANEFRAIFNQNFGNQRYRVELEFPSTSPLGTWHGYVQPDIQQRPLTDRTQKGVVSVTCADGLGALKDETRLNDAFNTVVSDFLIESLALAHGDLDIVWFTDSRGNRVTTSDQPVGLEGLVANEAPLSSFAPISGDHEGLEGSSVREQLENLCKTFHACLYQDIRIGAFSFMDAASVGVPVTGKKYDRSADTVDSYDFPDARVDLAEPRDESEDVLEPESSVRKVCVGVDNWGVDPKVEQFDESLPTDTGLHYVNQDGASLQFANDKTETKLVFTPGQDPVFNSFIGVDRAFVDAVRITTSGTAVGVAMRVVYGDGTSDTNTEVEPNILDLDPNKDEIRNVIWNFYVPSGGAGREFKSYDLELLQSEQVVQPDGSTETEYTRTETICFIDDGEGRTTRETNSLNYVTELADGSRATSDGYFSRRYQNVGNLARWRAINILSLLKPGIERLRDVALGQWLPLGTRIYWAKPGEASKSPFIHQTGRSLALGTEDLDAGTTLNELEVSQSVEDLIIDFTTESAEATVDLSISVTESVTAGTASESASIGVSLTPSVTETVS